jgi:hypothetical protein
MLHHASRVIALLIAGAGVASTAVAQDSRLSVRPVDPVLEVGETTSVEVLAHFPAAGFGFASAAFDVTAGMTGWTSAASGVLAGFQVLGASASQDHLPHLGVFADPANPLLIWDGVFEPSSYDPAVVRVEAAPSSFWWYPSDLTSSAVEDQAKRGRNYIFVNPITLASGVRFAMGDGSVKFITDRVESGRAGAGTDVVTASRGNDEPAVLIGLLVPAIQKVDVAPFPEGPDGLSIDLGVGPGPDAVPLESYSLNFEKIKYEYKPRAAWPGADGFAFDLFSGGVVVASFESTDGEAPFVLSRLPDSVTPLMPIEVRELIIRADVDPAGAPMEAFLPGAVDPIAFDTLIVRAIDPDLPEGSRVAHAVFEATGVDSLTLEIGAPNPADLNGDGVVDGADLGLLVGMWGDCGSAFCPADLNGDGVVDGADLGVLLGAWG